MRPLPLLLAAFLFSLDLQAATTYRVTFETASDQRQMHTAIVTAADTAFRADFEFPEGFPKTYDFVLSHDSGRSLVAVNDDLQTWYDLDRSPFIVYSRYFSGLMKDVRALKVKWSVVSDDPGATAGPAHVGTLSYLTESDFHGTRVRSKHTVKAEVWPTQVPSGVSWPALVLFRTGLAPVDEVVARSTELLQQFPAKIVIRITRQFDGGGAFDETHTITVDELRESAGATPGVFERPRHYRKQEPIVGAPGR